MSSQQLQTIRIVLYSVFQGQTGGGLHPGQHVKSVPAWRWKSALTRIPRSRKYRSGHSSHSGDGATHRVYSDRASGAKEGRPGLDALMEDAKRGLFDVVIVWRFDRFARSVKQLVLALEEFHSLGIDFISHQEALDTSTPMGRMVFTVIAAMAELERAIIRDRVLAGLDHAQRNGTKWGKAVGRPKAIVDADEVVRLRDQEKLSWPEIGRKTRSSSGTVRRVYNAAVARLRGCQNPMAEAL